MEASTSDMSAVTNCSCKSSCATKRKENSNRGCPCKTKNVMCSANCKCGTRKTSCKNRENVGETGGSRDRSPRGSNVDKGFRGLTQRATNDSADTEDEQREKENNDVKVFVNTLDDQTIKKLAIRSLRRGIGSMDYIHTLLITEDDLNANVNEMTDEASMEQQCDLAQGGEGSQTLAQGGEGSQTLAQGGEGSQTSQPTGTDLTAGGEVPPWCVCSNCRPMPQDIENKCCNLKNCITMSSRFSKVCLDPDVLELCIRNIGDIRNDREDNSTRSFRKAAYRQFILARHGYLGKGNRRVCPSCVVLKIRQRYPSVTGVYMGYRER